jgi:hypothetical protein
VPDAFTQFEPANPLPDPEPDRDGGPVPVIDLDGPFGGLGKPGHHPQGPAVDPVPPDLVKKPTGHGGAP